MGRVFLRSAGVVRGLLPPLLFIFGTPVIGFTPAASRRRTRPGTGATASDSPKMCDTPGCSLTQRHAGCHSFVLSLPGKRERQHTAKSEQHRSANVTGSTSAESLQELGLLSSYLEGCGGTASMVEEWSVRFGPPRAHGSRQDLTFCSPCGKTFRSKVEVARFLGLEVVAARQKNTVASSSSTEAVQALGLLSSHLEGCGGAASMVEEWRVAVGPPRAVKDHGRSHARQDLTFFSPCGTAFRSKVEVARYLGLESGPPQQASSKRAKRTKPAGHLRGQALWVDAVVVVEADDVAGDVDAMVVEAVM